MSTIRSIWLVSVPTIAVVAGIIWYRKRSLTFTDPGGSLEIQTIEEIKNSDIEKEIETTSNQKPLKINTPSPDPLDNTIKSAPINIPVGSPIQLTDDQIDLEIKKMQSQKSHDKDYTMSSSVLEFDPVAFKSLQSSVSSGLMSKPFIISEKSTESVENLKLFDEYAKEFIKTETNNDSKLYVEGDKCSTEGTEHNNKPSEAIIETELNLKNFNVNKENEKRSTEFHNEKQLEIIETTADINSTEGSINATEVPTDKPTDRPTEESAEGSAEGLAEALAEGSAEESTEESVEGSTEVIKNSDEVSAHGFEGLCESNAASVLNNRYTGEDWSEEDQYTRVRDSAYNSSTENIGCSPKSNSNCSEDNRTLLSLSPRRSESGSERSSDSGKGSVSTRDIYYFAFPIRSIGRLIGSDGKFVNRIKEETGAVVVANANLSDTMKLCYIEGTNEEINHALFMIRQRFPKGTRPEVSLAKVILQAPKVVLKTDFFSLSLDEKETNICQLASIHNGFFFSVHLPTHQSYFNLQKLLNQMTSFYQTSSEAPALPDDITTGNICACLYRNTWYRAMIIQTLPRDDVVVRLLDYGVKLTVKRSDLKQIRQDYLLMPFQAIDCCMAHIKPPAGVDERSTGAANFLMKTIKTAWINVNWVGYTEDGIPLVDLYFKIKDEQVVYVNKELVKRGFAEKISCDESW